MSKPEALECVDLRTSQPLWTYAVRRDRSDAWASDDDEALVFDEDNLTLVRVGAKGERWRAALRGVGFTDDESTAPTNWSFSSDVGVWDASDGRVQVVNLLTGSIQMVEL